MALAWEYDLDDDQDDPEFDFYAGLVLATANDTLPATILERLAATRPAWHALAACRGRNDLSWFDQDGTAAARSVCETCPVSGPCGHAGRRERFGVWGGRPPVGDPLRRQKAPTTLAVVAAEPMAKKPAKKLVAKKPAKVAKKPKVVVAKRPRQRACLDCGDVRPIEARDLCRRCYRGAQRRAAGIQPRAQARPRGQARPRVPQVRACAGCGEVRHIEGRDLCKRCYSTEWRRAQGVPPKPKGHRVEACADCGIERRVWAHDLCRPCYQRAWRRDRTEALAGSDSRPGPVGSGQSATHPVPRPATAPDTRAPRPRGSPRPR